MRTDLALGNAALLHLGAIWPQAVTVAELVPAALERLGAAAGPVRENLAEQVDSLTAMLLRCFCHGVIEIDAFPVPLTATISERPQASLLARKQLETGALLTSLRHCTVAFEDPITKHLLTLLDGTRTIDQLVAELSQALPNIMPQDREKDGSPAEPPVISRDNVERNLQFLARLALLVG
jgi:protein-lysine methyltransferase-like protein